jgi:hypothetical protein
MKSKFKKITKTIVFILIPMFLWNCASEEIGVKNSEVATKTFLEEINQSKHSLDELTKDQKINTILNDALKGLKQPNPHQKNLNNPPKIALSNTVTKFSRLDYTSYTIPVINSNENSTSFQNIIIETDDLREAAYLITYTPNNNYQQAKYAHTIYDDQTIYYIANSNIECLYYKRKINKIPNNGSTQKTVSSTNPLIEESLVDCVVTFYPGHNCTAGGDHAVGQSCSGTGGQRAEGPVVYVSCRNIPEAPPTIPRDPSGNGGISPDTSLHGASGGTPLQLDPLANYSKSWICMNPPQCSELIPYTPTLTIPMNDPYNFYAGILPYDQITTLLRFENSDVKNAIDVFLLENQNANGHYNKDVTDMVREIVNQKNKNPNLNLDINASFKSPMNIDFGTISNNTPEGAKFNEIYNSLTESPEFQKLFLDIFKDSKRFNVKFEIVDNLPRPKKPNEQDNGQTILIPNSTNITIKINKQILTSVTGGIANLSKMAIAKTILHECIHAYLHIKGMYPNAGASIPGIEEMDLQKVINAIYGKDSDQHTFMYENMVKTMQGILSQLKDKLTTEDRRIQVEDLSIHPTKNPLTSASWNWNDYFKYLSLSGLNETKIFLKDFPKDSNAEFLYKQYYGHGETYLDKN